jgi:putative transposase
LALVDPNHQLNIRKQSEVLNIHVAAFIISLLDLMETMDRLFTEDPTLGVIGMQDELREQGLFYNVKRIRRLLHKMGVEPIYPKRNLSKLGRQSMSIPIS